ncbi:CGNR zinc finger domain-containing protein [Nocardia bovistercoris]|uniref:CGNR zinc finger domain-containing protein n=1 Tax=Nocardia bovistercoris TaxID=2785916 RepID=A0A931IG18_9NOCA|nr:CGNR zinc finger domain-containing protein [Nocardia bovistercoris]MBH0780879.1 CGNR zinc finger domain-containing protein [Nocardia bovistercoris]
MHFNHDGREAVCLGVDLANRWPPNLPALISRCTDAGLVFDAQQPTSDDHEFMASFIAAWRNVAEETRPEARADRLNALLGTYAAPPRLTDHASTGWHLHFRDDNVTAGNSLAALIATGTAFHLAARGIDRLGVCAAANCDDLFADTSRNGRQRYCSPKCGNRMAVRRYRDAAYA